MDAIREGWGDAALTNREFYSAGTWGPVAADDLLAQVAVPGGIPDRWPEPGCTRPLMTPPHLLHFDGPDALADGAAGRWLDLLRARAGSTGGRGAAEPSASLPERPFCVALSGGRIAGAFYDALIRRGQMGLRLNGGHMLFVPTRNNALMRVLGMAL